MKTEVKIHTLLPSTLGQSTTSSIKSNAGTWTLVMFYYTKKTLLEKS